MISIREIARAGVYRFLPAMAGLMAALLFAPFLSDPHGFSLGSLRVLFIELGGMTGGFIGSLALMHERLDRSANVMGRRTVIAAILSVVALLFISTVAQGSGYSRIVAFSIICGALSGFGMYWPWVRRRVSERELLAIENVDVEALAEAHYQADHRRTNPKTISASYNSEKS